MSEDIIDVPVIYITDGWTCDDLESDDDCDDAFAVLTGIIVAIETKMDNLAAAGLDLSPEYIKARGALRWKKAALSVVHNKRSQFKRNREASIMSLIKAYEPDAYQRAAALYEASVTKASEASL